MTIYCTANQKGGVGKTAIAAQLLLYLADLGHKVLAFDADPQANLTGMLLQTMDSHQIKYYIQKSMMRAIADKDLSQAIVPFKLAKIDILASSTDFWQYPRYIGSMYPDDSDYAKRVLYLPKLMKPLFEKYDDVVIDTPPTRGIVTQSALIMSQIIILMMETQPDSLKGAVQFLQHIQETYKQYGGKLQNIVVLPNIFRKHNSLETAVLKQAKDQFGADSVLKPVPYMARFERYSATGLPVKRPDYFDKQVIKTIRQSLKPIINEK